MYSRPWREGVRGWVKSPSPTLSSVKREGTDAIAIL